MMQATPKLHAGSRGVMPALRKTLTTVPPSIWVLAALLLYCVVARPVMLQSAFQMVILRQAAPLGMAVCAQLLVMRCRSIDLSIGAVFVLTNFVVTSPFAATLSPALVLLLALAVGGVVGLANGLFVTVLRASSVIVTLAMAAVVTGLVLFLQTDIAAGSVPQIVQTLGNARLQTFPVAALVWFGVALLLAVPLNLLVFGRLMKAIGSNPEAATISGLPVRGMLLVAHIGAGVLAAIGGLLLTGYVGVATSAIGSDVVMNSIAGVILGGVTFGSGRGGLLGPTIAAFALTLLFNVLNVFGIGESGKLIVQGCVIAVAAVLAGVAQRARR